MHVKKVRVIGVKLLLAGLVCVTPALGQTGGGYDLSWNTIDGGGITFATGGGYSLGGTIGQADAGVHTGGQYTLIGGFWGAAATTPPEQFVWGDVNADDIAGAVDASLVLQWDAFLITSFPGYPGIEAPNFPEAANVSGDAVVGAVDASQILQMDAFLLNCFTSDTNCDTFGPE